MDISLDFSKDCDTPERFFQRQNKRYALEEMLTPSQKQCTTQRIIINRRKTEYKKSQYFQKMVKQQNKKMIVATFIKKLKRLIVRQTPTYHQSLELHERSTKFLNGLHISPEFQLVFSILSILEISFFLSIISLSTVFHSVEKSHLYFAALSFGFVFHILDIIKELVSTKNQDGKRFDKLNDIVKIYLLNQGFPDFLILIAYLAQFCFTSNTLTRLTRYFFLLKIIPLMKKLDTFEHKIIRNVYWQQVWQLIKLFLTNYIFAHFLALVLVSIARLNQDENWMKFRNIADKPDVEQYVWAYYWATTIMLTIGFGDITPVSTSQALCMIFIQTISCILLAYNINNVGSIISKLRSYSLVQNTNLKTFQNLTSTNSIPSQLSDRITNYIKESVEMKIKSNIAEQNNFIQTLPNSFKEDLLKECNKKVFTGLIFFKNLSQKVLLQLAIRIQRNLTHPQEIIHRRKDQLDVLIFNSGTVAYTYSRQSNRALYSNGKIVQKHIINQNEFRLLSLDFLFNSYFSFDVKCVDYTILYKMDQKTLFQILKGNPYDYEYFRMMKDKDKLLLNEFQVSKCQLCDKQKHSLEKCPNLHFIPLRQHVINKFLSKKISLELMIRLRNPRVSKTFYHPFLDRKIIKQELLRKRVQERDLMNNIASMVLTNLHQTSVQQGTDAIPVNVVSSIKNVVMMSQQSLYFQAAQKLKDEMSRVLTLQQNKDIIWEIETDSIQDFKYYFKKYNPENISIDLKRKAVKQRRKVKGGSMKAIF